MSVKSSLCNHFSFITILLLALSTIGLFGQDSKIPIEELRLRSNQFSADELIQKHKNGEIDDIDLFEITNFSSSNIRQEIMEYLNLTLPAKSDNIQLSSSNTYELELMGKFDEGLPASGRNGSKIGEVIANLGDINGDGIDDFASGIKEAADYESSHVIGKVYIYLGGNLTDDKAPDFILEGTEDEEYFGSCISTIGDFNNDGYSDFAIVSSGTKKLHLYLGASSISNEPFKIINNIENVSYAGDLNNDGFGDFLASSTSSVTVYLGNSEGEFLPNYYIAQSNQAKGIGDFNNDGYDDFVAWKDPDAAGEWEVDLFLGSENVDNVIDLSFIGVVDEKPRFGINLSSGGDINGDGFSDVIIGMDQGQLAGIVNIYLGANEIEAEADLIITKDEISSSYDNYFGFRTEIIGDYNIDGYDDFIISSDGRSFLFLGDSQIDGYMDMVIEDTHPDNSEGIITGDFNGDGISDFIISSNDQAIINRQDLDLYLGNKILNKNSNYTIKGENKGNALGYALSNVGDLNGDEYDDFILGSPFFSKDEYAQGRAYIFFGAENFDFVPDLILEGSNERMVFFGRVVSSAGDMNGDGFNDVLVTEMWGDPARVYVYFGGKSMDNIADEVFEGNIGFGEVASNAGDINNDGFDDILIRSNKMVKLYLGGKNINQNPALVFDENIDWFGYSISSAGDFNNDGFSDIIIGTNSSDDGKAFLYLGGNPIDNDVDLVFSRIDNYEFFGRSVSSVQDFNNDGYSDIMIGAPGKSKVYLFLGNNENDNIADITFYGQGNFGASLSTAGDINDDGYSDIIIGGSNSQNNVFIYHGNNVKDNNADNIITLPVSTKETTFYVSMAGDINNDNYSDIIIASPYNNSAGYNMGRAFLYAGSPIPNPPDITVPSDQKLMVGDHFNYALNWQGHPRPTFELIEGPEGLTLGEDNALLLWTPVSKDKGVFTLKVKATNSEGSDEISFNITVNELNKAPTLTNNTDKIIFNEDIVYDSLHLKQEFTDANYYDILKYTYSNNTNISVKIDTSGKVELTPKLNWYGSEKIKFTATDDSSASITTQIKIDILPVNDSPTAITDTISVDEDEEKLFSTKTFLSNDYDIEEDSIKIGGIISDSTLGRVDIDSSLAGISYLPVKDFYGTDTLFYLLEDVFGARDTGLVVLKVKNVNDAPEGIEDTLFVNEDNQTQLFVLENDIDVDEDELFILKVVITNLAGELKINEGSKSLTYTPEKDFTGSTSFYYVLNDGSIEGNDTTKVELIIKEVNDYPLAEKDFIESFEDQEIVISYNDLLINDSDKDGGTLKVEKLLTKATIGSILINAGDTSLTYTPKENYYGTDSLVYVLSDSQGGFDTSSVYFSLIPVQDVPSLFSLVSPLNNAEKDSADINFVWKRSLDADGEDVYYDFYLNNNNRDTSILNLADTTLIFEGSKFLSSNSSYNWYVTATDNIDTVECVTTYTFSTANILVDVKMTEGIPSQYLLDQNYPNPFNPSTNIKYELPQQSSVKLVIYNMLGEEIITLVDSEQSVGYYEVSFDASHLSSGIYLYQLKTNDFISTKKMLLVK